MKKILTLLLLLASVVFAEGIIYQGEKIQSAGDYTNGRIIKAAVTDNNGTAILSFDGALNVHDPHGHHTVVHEQFHQHTATTTTFAANATAGDNGLLGNIPALSNGVVMRVYDGATGKFRTISNWKTNSGIVLDGYTVSYAARSGGGGAYGTNANGNIYDNSGAVIRLNGATGDYIEILVQNDLSSLLSFRQRLLGHIEGN